MNVKRSTRAREPRSLQRGACSPWILEKLVPLSINETDADQLPLNPQFLAANFHGLSASGVFSQRLGPASWMRSGQPGCSTPPVCNYQRLPKEGRGGTEFADRGHTDYKILGAPRDDNSSQKERQPQQSVLKGYFSDVVEKQNSPDRQTERGKRGKRCRAFADRPVAGDQESAQKKDANHAEVQNRRPNNRYATSLIWPTSGQIFRSRGPSQKPS